MSTISQIKVEAASYLNVTVSELTQNGLDLFLMAANESLTSAELNHDFEFNRKLVTVSVNGTTGGDLGTAVDGAATAVAVKTVIEVGLLDEQSNLIPVDWTTVSESIERQRGDNGFCFPRYPTDGWARSTPGGVSRFTFSGDTINRWPKTPDSEVISFALWLEVYAFTTPWTATDISTGTSNIWTTRGKQYILWSSIIRLNKLFMRFVQRQEGVLPPPTELASEGLQSLLDWDNNKLEEFRRHGR